jgi:hypothetical protein
MEIVSIWHFIFIGVSLTIIVLGPTVFKIYKMDRKLYFFILCGGYLVTRIFTLAVFYSMGWAGAYDNTTFFFPQANNVIAGLIPYLDFQSSYGPYFAYLLAPFVLIFNDSRVIPFALIAFDILTLVVSDRYVARTLSNNGRRLFLWTYVFIPTIWFFTVRLNQDEIILAFFVTLSLLLVALEKEELAGLCMGLGFLSTKFLIAIFYIPILAQSKQKTRTLFLAGLVVILGYVPFLILGADILMPLTAETGSFASGANIWIALEILGISTEVVPHIVAAVAVLVVFALFLISDSQSSHKEAIPIRIRNTIARLPVEHRMVLVGILFMILDKKTWMFYLEIFVVFLIIAIIRTTESARGNRNSMLVWALFLGYIVLMGVSSYYTAFLVGNIGSPLTLDWLASIIVYLLSIFFQIAMMALMVYAPTKWPDEYPVPLNKE